MKQVITIFSNTAKRFALYISYLFKGEFTKNRIWIAQKNKDISWNQLKYPRYISVFCDSFQIKIWSSMSKNLTGLTLLFQKKDNIFHWHCKTVSCCEGKPNINREWKKPKNHIFLLTFVIAELKLIGLGENRLDLSKKKITFAYCLIMKTMKNSTSSKYLWFACQYKIYSNLENNLIISLNSAIFRNNVTGNLMQRTR